MECTKLGNLGVLQSGSVPSYTLYLAILPSWENSLRIEPKKNLATLSLVQTAPMYLKMLLAGSLLHLLLYTSKRELTWSVAALLLLKFVNLQYITLGCLDIGTNESSTKCLMFQVLFFFHHFLQSSLQNSLQKSFQFIFLFS